MGSLNFADIFVTFLALLGPQKILLSFDEASRRLRPHEARLLALYSSLAAAAVGVVRALSAPWLTRFFHISYQAVELAGGIVFFLAGGSAPVHPVASGFRARTLPYVVTPLGVTAVLVQALSGAGWGRRALVAVSYVAVAALDFVSALLPGPVIRRMHASLREVLSRLVGLLLAGVGMNIFLQGLVGLGVLPHYGSGGH